MQQEEITVKPFLRWAGGKNWLIKEFSQFPLEDINNYFEPFIGGGSIFLYLTQIGKLKNQAYISDINKELIDCYIQIRDNVESVISNLCHYRNDKSFYYSIRDTIPSSDSEAAARFIYLNRTSFNGIYRVNLNGVYNVPYGFKHYPVLFDYDNLRGISKMLKNTNILHCDFQLILQSVQKKDFVFLDPPYTVAHGNNGFIKYNQKLFSWQDQKRLKETAELITDKGAYFLLTNASHPSIDALFCNIGTKIQFDRYSVIGGKHANRGKIKEYIFTNLM